MAQLICRNVGADGEPQWGQGQSNFITDIDAVGLIIRTRLLLFLNEWWADRLDGLPLWQEILGVPGAGNNLQKINLLIQDRILKTPFVTGISSVQSSYDSAQRKFQFSAVVQTQFGQVALTHIPQPPSQGLPQ